MTAELLDVERVHNDRNAHGRQTAIINDSSNEGTEGMVADGGGQAMLFQLTDSSARQRSSLKLRFSPLPKKPPLLPPKN
jgi:hypothetical protein